MPIYAYQCGNCGQMLDKLQKISDPVLTRCPACNEDSLKRLLTAPNFRLSGSGWYETDFKHDKDKQKNLTDYQKDSTNDTKTDVQSDVKTTDTVKKDSPGKSTRPESASTNIEATS